MVPQDTLTFRVARCKAVDPCCVVLRKLCIKLSEPKKHPCLHPIFRNANPSLDPLVAVLLG